MATKSVELPTFLLCWTPAAFLSYCNGRNELRWRRWWAAVNQAICCYRGTNSFLDQSSDFDDAFTSVQDDTNFITHPDERGGLGGFVVHSHVTAAAGGGAG